MPRESRQQLLHRRERTVEEVRAIGRGEVAALAFAIRTAALHVERRDRAHVVEECAADERVFEDEPNDLLRHEVARRRLAPVVDPPPAILREVRALGGAVAACRPSRAAVHRDEPPLRVAQPHLLPPRLGVVEPGLRLVPRLRGVPRDVGKDRAVHRGSELGSLCLLRRPPGAIRELCEILTLDKDEVELGVVFPIGRRVGWAAAGGRVVAPREAESPRVRPGPTRPRRRQLLASCLIVRFVRRQGHRPNRMRPHLESQVAAVNGAKAGVLPGIERRVAPDRRQRQRAGEGSDRRRRVGSIEERHRHPAFPQRPTPHLSTHNAEKQPRKDAEKRSTIT